MKELFSKIVKVLGWLILLAAFASIGFASDKPGLMVPLFFVFFVVVFTLVLLFNIRRQKQKEVNPVVVDTIKKAFGLILLLLSILMPYFFFKDAGFSSMIFILLSVIVIALVVLTIIAVRLINSKSLVQSLAGYVLLIIVCSVPAIVMIQHDRTYHALGGAYYAALVISVLAWTGISTLGKYIKI
jgi:hypothetical protein